MSLFFCSADALIVVATETIATAANPIIVLPIMVLIPVSGHNTPAISNMKLNSSDTVARVRQYRAVSPEDRVLSVRGTFRLERTVGLGGQETGHLQRC